MNTISGPAAGAENRAGPPAQVRPDFFDRFFCLAGRCRHSCCREGWEIDVDPDTRALYQSLDGPLGEAARECLQEEDGCWSLRHGPDGACPLLREDGLCRVVLELGEDGLCDICALHPRFYEDVGETELAGAGLCCEAAAALLLEGRGALRFLTETDEALSLEELLGRLGLEAEEGALRYEPRTGAAHFREIFRRYARCEAIDAEWERELAALAARPELAGRQARSYARRRDRTAFQRIFEYILYRQLELAGTYGLPALLRYAREAADFILLWAAARGDLPERLRRWSAQTEYSADNVAFLLGGPAPGGT